MAKKRKIIFRIFYSTSFTAFFILTVCFICVGPADAFYDSWRKGRIIDIFILAGAYVITALLAILFYASRIFTNRGILRDIPKSYLPIEEGDLPEKKIRRLIEQYFARNAIIAHQAKPRSVRIEIELPVARERVLKYCGPGADNNNKAEPRWGPVIHPGWASPESKDLPNLQYSSVVNELTDLIEAKAFSLAPIDPTVEPDPDGTAMPQKKVIDALTRPDSAGMRHYLSHLIQLGVVPDTSLPVSFLMAYEKARFHKSPMTETEFQTLMRLFAELLRSMTPLETSLVDLLDSESEDDLGPAGEIDDDEEDEDDSESDFYQSQRPSRIKPEPDSDTDTEAEVSSVRQVYNPGLDHVRDGSISSSESMLSSLSVEDHTRANTDPLIVHSEPALRLTSQSQTNFSSPLAQPPLVARVTTIQSTSTDDELSPTQSRTEVNPITTGQENVRARRIPSRSTTSGSGSGSASMRSARSAYSDTGSVIRLARPEDGHDLPYTIPFPRLEGT